MRSEPTRAHKYANLALDIDPSNTQTLKELKEAAYDLGCNAVIGVDFDYITLEPETVNGRWRNALSPLCLPQ